MTTTIGAIVLAAGFSSRFGGFKLGAELANGSKVIQQTLRRIRCAGLPAVVITRPESVSLLGLADVQIETFDAADRGMGATLAFGATFAKDWDGCLVCLADMPFVESSTYSLIAERLTPDSIVIPSYHLKPGNPVGFGRKFLPQLRALDGDSGGRILTMSNLDAVIELELDDPAILRDIDTPADLARYQE